MTEKEFFDYLIERYMEETGQDLPAQGLGYYLEYFLDNYSTEKLEVKLTKKICARMIHEFMMNVLKISDVDWNSAGDLKDIYDCRVCANSIAQVYERGIMGVSSEKIFGLNELVSDSDAEKHVDELMKMTVPHN
ncbi:MAG: hypothetical protein K6A23_04495 [Butyrivibrio sp.]|nr:hypothetical protein [Butyrivibrio sp.]